MERRFLEECLAKGMSLEAIGELVGKHPSTVGYWLKKHGLHAAGSEKYARRGGISQDDLEPFIERGATLGEIAAALERSISTVRYWLGRYDLRTANPRGRRRRCGDGSRLVSFECKRHGTTEFILERRGYYRCKRCRAAAVAKRRRTVKKTLVEEAGGACRLCGYARCLNALQFHHLESDSKSFHLAHRGHSRSIGRSREEMRKCILLCANCHAEVEGGFATLPEGLLRISEDVSR
jgi:transposase